uniref:WIF domain-containing protein n=1 Tax=Macrostomum lignano TaxID=282301 RepID=A0A1I8I0R6_9PLAT
MCHFLRWFLTIGLLISLVSKNFAANHYCIHEHTLSLLIDEFYNRDELLIPRVLGTSPQDQIQIKCRWDIKLKIAKPGTQLRISALPNKKDGPKTADGDAKLSVDFLNSNSVSVTTGMFQVLPATEHRRFTVEVNWDPGMQKPSSDYLRILLPIPGQCGRDMLWFNGSCYAVSAVQQSVADATDSVGGDAQLASFSSMAEISEFVVA